MPSSRRRFIASSFGLAAALASAGCISDGPGTDGESPDGSEPPQGSPDTTPTPAPESAQRSVGGASVAVTDIVAEKAVTYESVMGSGGVVAPEGRQFVVASVRSDAELEMDQFSLDAGGESWAAVDPGDHGARNYSVAGHEGGVVGEPATGGSDTKRYVVFELDSPLETEEARIVLDHGSETAEWALPDAARERLAAPSPSFDLNSLSVPGSVQQGEPLPVELTVTNTGEVDGRFLAAAHWPTHRIADDDESHLIDESVAAGDSVTASLSIDTEYTAAEESPITLGVEGHVEADREVVLDGGTETPQ
ncbi:hypothetical protein JCM30237_29500 [Halolamina litorea]|uniref:DUF4352 domain-containing protein n=1 Tax=Halolamina litorea TaxID=1515593 RepID=A0ABD6BUQ0_9EURY|nr:hypothetical protein [Halolamina litorea]